MVLNKNILELLAGIVLLIWASFFAGSDIKPELQGMSIGIFLTLLINVISFLYNEWSLLGIYSNSYLHKPNAPLRLSFAYLFRIEHNGKYLLVKNNRFTTPTYQPVGGVYKYFSPEGKKALNKLGIVTDNSIENDEKSEFDLRVKMRKRVRLRAFIKWFQTGTQRETNPWREFYEELIVTGALPGKQFPYLFFDQVGSHFEPIHLDEYFGLDTLKYADIYVPRFINQEQSDILGTLMEASNEEIIWVTEEEINRRQSKCGKRIAPHTYKIFHYNK